MTLNLNDLRIPTPIADGIVESAKTGSVVAALSAQEPMRFGNIDIVTFEEDLAAEFVAEGAAKGSTTATPSHVTAVPRKAVVQMRCSDEFLEADAEFQTGILDTFADKYARALARSLDLGLLYRLNPRTNTELTAWTNYLNATTLRVETTADAEVDFETAAGLVIADGHSVNGVAVDPSHAQTLSTARFADGRKKFPELGLGGAGMTSLYGVPAAVSSTVSGKPVDGSAADNSVKAVVGDFNNGIRWGVQREMPIRVLTAGDPDNTSRDLAGHNEVLLRSEIIFAWYVDPARFAVMEASV